MAYYIATDRFGNYDLEHGVKWRQHKYIRKEGNRYIYPEDLKEKAIHNAAREQQKGRARTKSYTERGMAAAHPELPEKYRKELVNANPYDSYYKERGRLEETNPAKGHAMDAASKAQWDGKTRTRQIWKDGGEYHGVIIGYGDREYGAAKRREFEQNASERKKAAEIGDKQAQASRAIVTANRRGEHRTALESRRSNGLSDVYTRHFRDRVMPGVEQRAKEINRKKQINNAINSVKKWGSNTLNSAKGAAAKGAAWVSNLLKRKK